MIAVSDPIVLAAAALVLLSAVAVIVLAVRALRGTRGKDDDEHWNAPPSP